MAVAEDLLVGILASLAASLVVAVFLWLRRKLSREHIGMALEPASKEVLLRNLGPGAAAYQEGKMLMEKGRASSAIKAFDRALPNAKTPTDELAVRARLGLMLLAMGNFPKALVEFQRCLKVAETAGDLLSKAGSLRKIALIYTQTGRSREAVEIYKDAMVLYEQIGTRHQRVDFGGEIVVALLDRQEIRQAIRLNAQSLRFHVFAGSLSGMFPAGVNWAAILLRHEKVRYAAAVLTFLQWFPFGRKDARLLATMKGMQAVCRKSVGDLRSADKMLADCLKISRDHNFRDLEALAVHEIAELKLRAGDMSEGLLHAQLAEKMFREMNHMEGEAKSIGLMGDIRGRQGNPQEAILILKRALAIAERAGSVDSTKNILLALHTYLHAAKRGDEFGPLASSVISRNHVLGTLLPADLLSLHSVETRGTI